MDDARGKKILLKEVAPFIGPWLGEEHCSPDVGNQRYALREHIIWGLGQSDA